MDAFPIVFPWMRESRKVFKIDLFDIELFDKDLLDKDIWQIIAT